MPGAAKHINSNVGQGLGLVSLGISVNEVLTAASRPGIRGQGLNVCLLPYNQVQIPLTDPCLQQNFSLIKRFRDCTTFLHPLPLQNMLLPNSFIHAAFAHQQYNCSGNERAKAANWDGNIISNQATLAAPPNPTIISRCMNRQPHTQMQRAVWLQHCHKLILLPCQHTPPLPGRPDSGSSFPSIHLALLRPKGVP